MFFFVKKKNNNNNNYTMHSNNLFSIWHWQFFSFFISEITIRGVTIFFYFLKVDVLTKYFITELQKIYIFSVTTL